MASPFVLFMVPETNLRIRVIRSHLNRSSTSSNISQSHRYVFEDFSKFPLKKEKQNEMSANDYIGFMSPFFPISLPEISKKRLGINIRAKKYAYIQSQPELAAALDWDNSEDSEGNNFLSNTSDLLTLGGFAYFDEKEAFLHVNVISLLNKTDNRMFFSGPYNANELPIKCLQRLNRIQRRPHMGSLFHEIGYMSIGWIGPNENFNNELATDETTYHHGAFVALRQNGTAIVFVLTKSISVDPQGDFDYFSETISVKREGKFQGNDDNDTEGSLDFLSNFHESESCVSSSIKILFEDRSMVGENFRDGLAKKKTLIHKACESKCSSEIVEILLDGNIELLKHEHSFGWLPLHYACCFHPDFTLVKLLIDLYKEAVFHPDIFGRYPLHIALGSNASEEVIEILMREDEKFKILTMPTKHMKLLPIHLACIEGASENIFRMLLPERNGKSRSSISQKTLGGSLPLHYALLKNLPHTIIEMLITKEVFGESYVFRKNQIHERREGMLPLHIACWKNASPEVIRILLQYDRKKTTVTEEVGITPWTEHNLQSIHSLAGEQYVQSMIPLHLAVRHNSHIEVIRLLLDQSCHSLQTVTYFDKFDNCALHLACRKGRSFDVLNLILAIDKSHETTQLDNIMKCRPVHYLCRLFNEEDSAKKLELLLTVEDEFIDKNPIKAKKKSVSSCDARNNNPLATALLSSGHDSLIEVLLRPKNFDAAYVDPNLLQKLAERACNDSQMQNEIVNTLMKPSYFCIMLMMFYVKVFLIVSFVLATDNHIFGESYENAKILFVVWFLFLALFEAIEFYAQGVSYLLGDIWNLVDFVSVILLFKTVVIFYRDYHESDHIYLTLSSFFIGLGTVGSLGYTFLPFARFISGMTAIAMSLIPFVLVTFIILFVFGYVDFVRYPVETIDEACHNGMGSLIGFMECFQHDLKMLLSEPDAEKMDSLPRISRIFFMYIILLNIVFAVINEGWTEAADRAFKVFWGNRIRFLSSYQFVHDVFEKSLVFEGIRKISPPSVQDSVIWTNAPYSSVSSLDMYKNPHKYLTSGNAQTIIESHSLYAEFYWIGIDDPNRSTRDFNKLWAFRKKVNALFRWLQHACTYWMFILLGFVTVGLFWPDDFRRKFLTLGNNKRRDLQGKSEGQRENSEFVIKNENDYSAAKEAIRTYETQQKQRK